jgi:flagellar motor protein MotB
MIQNESIRRFITSKRLRISLSVLVILIVLFGLLGYFWLPGYAKDQLEAELSKILHRPVSVQSIDIQPFSLELIVRGFKIGKKVESAGPDNILFSVGELYVNVSTASITHRAPVISSVTIKTPMLYLIREGENHFNITDLIEDFSKKPEDDSKAMFSISNIVIEGGHFEFIDHFKNSHQKVSEINFGIPFISNFENDLKTWVEPYFNAKVNGSPFILSGKVRPFSGKKEAIFDLKLNNIDLIQIDEYSPVQLGIRLLSGFFDSNLQLVYTQEADQTTKMVISGNTSLREFELENKATEKPYNIKFDQLDVKLTDIDLSGQKPAQITLGLAGASLVQPEKTEPILSFVKLGINKIVIDPSQKNVVFGIVKFDQLKASIRREADGQLNLTQHFTPLSVEKEPVEEATRQEVVAEQEATGQEVVAEQEEAEQEVVAEQEEAEQEVVAEQEEAEQEVVAETETNLEGSGKLWEAKIESLQIADAALHFEDLTLTKVAPMVVDPLNLNISNIDFNGVDPLKLALQATVNQQGSLETNGSLAWSPIAFDFVIDVKDIDLVSLQGWAGDHLNALLTRGEVSFDGVVKADGEPLKIILSGKSRFSNFNIFDKATATDLLRWREFDISGIEFVNEPLRVDIDSVAIADFFANVIVSPDGKINLKSIVRQDGAEEITSAKSEAETQVQVKSQTDEATPVHIGKIVLQGGNIDFNDQFIKPNYRANLTGIAGQIGPLNPGKPGAVNISGAVDKTAPLEIKGELDPFGSEIFLDIAAKATGINLPTFSPYSGKYIGYVIEKGKLSVDIHYYIKEGELKAENSIFLDQFILGEKIESPDALDIPLKLAIALLKNQRGEIDLNLPIKGSINDPEFNLGGIIVRVFVNLLTKAVTSPFALLGSLAGGGEELSEINFLPGYGQVEPEAEKRLQALSKALADRPALKLEITGYADPKNDPDGLKRAILDRKVKAQKLSAGAEKGESVGSLQDVSVEPEEYEKFLELAYEEEKFDKPKNVIGLTKDLPVPEMEQLMLTNINAGDDKLRKLAEQRGKAARDWLVEKGGISSDRVFVLEPEIKSEVDGKKLGSKAKFSIK